MMKSRFVVSILFAWIVVLAWSPAMAADYSCEVMTIKGAAFVTTADVSRKPIKAGDLLKAGDLVEVEKGGQVDLAFDRGWNNITRIWESSKVKIRSIYPTGLALDRGDIFSKLGKLPKGTTFEIQTPTAIAAVRGTEFLTSVSDKGETSVISYERSVEVFNLDASGKLGDHVVVDEAQKTVVGALNEAPTPPAKAPESDLQKVAESSSQINGQVKEMTRDGRFANIQSAGSVEAMIKLAEIYKKTEEGQKGEKRGSTDDKKAAGNDGGGGPGGNSGGLSSEQRQEMKDRFIRLGGNASDLDLAAKQMESSGIDSANFDHFKDTFSNYMDHPGSFSGPGGSGSFNDPLKRESQMPFRGGEPPAMQQIENQMNRTLTTTEMIQANKCLADPNSCPPPQDPTGIQRCGSYPNPPC